MKRRHSGQKWSKTQFMGVPMNVLRSLAYIKLSNSAARLFFDIYGQFTGNNNGDFTASFSVMKRFGWRSKNTLSSALRELLESELVIETRQGIFNSTHSQCALYGVTFKPIDACQGKLDVAATKTPMRLFHALSNSATPTDGHGAYRRKDRRHKRDALGRFLAGQQTD
ncbi:hypothetical protein N9W66_08620 [Luminiphilus sp.]|nr:hypothetical protein [Luminiphilus sp.]